MMDTNLMPQISEKSDILLAKLMKAKQEIGTVKKDSKNPFHKSNYASLNAYIDASEAHLVENGLILVQAGNGSFEKPIIIATLIHPESGQWIKSYLPILNPKQDSQGLGASVTYMRRYSLATLLGLVSEDDDGETAVGRGKYDQQKKKAIPAEVTEEDKKKDEEKLGKLLDMFDKVDQHLVLEYSKIVGKHFSWSQGECVGKFLEDKDLLNKFEKWKSKRKAA